MKKTAKFRILMVAIAILVSLVASSQAQEEQILTKLVIIPQEVVLGAGESIQFTVEAFDQYNKHVKIPAIFAVEDKDIGTINSTGYFTSLENGKTKVMTIYDTPSGRTFYNESIVKVKENKNVNILIWLIKLLQIVM